MVIVALRCTAGETARSIVSESHGAWRCLLASEEQCRQAIEELIERRASYDHSERSKHVPDRTVGVTLLDLDVTYAGDIKDGELINVRQEPGDFRPQVRVVCTSDDLIALTDGSLNFAHAWATGRVRLDASLRDLLRLRSLA